MLQSNRSARIRAQIFPGGQVRPSEIPFAGAPGPRYSGEQTIVRAGMGRGPATSPAGAPAAMVMAVGGSKPAGAQRVRPGGFGSTGMAPRQAPEARNASRAADHGTPPPRAPSQAGPNGNMLIPWKWISITLGALLIFRR
jgi:hypothetical protein